MRWLGAIAFCLAMQAAAADETPSTVVVMTSFPASFYSPLQHAFETRHPDLRLRILNRKTTAGVATLIDRSRGSVDIFWASATDAFVVLATAGRLARLPPRTDAVPRMIGGFPIDDPDGRYRGFALSGYGVVWNAAYMERHGLAPPRRIAHLRSPEYAGHVGMTAPSRSGTTHLMVEALLQQEGWDEGWSTWIELAGNLATVTARSFGVSAGAAHGRFGVGLSIDFLGRATAPDADGLRFAYPAENVFLPASVAILRDAPNRAGAERFVSFLLSDAGQRLLVSPAVGRLPVDPAAYAGAVPDGANPYRIFAEHGWPVSFDAALSGQRYELVNLLFDEAITYRLQPLREAWRRLHDAEKRAAGARSPQAAGLLAQARVALTAVPVTAAQARDAAYVEGLRHLPWGVTPPPRQAALVGDWRGFFEARLADARQSLARADALLGAAHPSPGQARP